jgi:CubicO group peptidase (beta-lactamase class C family)
MTFQPDKLQHRLDELTKKHRVPGAALAILDGDTVTEVATGVANQETGVEVTSDTLFQIGSISKVFTTTLVMQLVDEGKVELDAPVKRYLPEFEVADRTATEQVTVRQLLDHTSGIDGDHFTDTGRGDDCVEKYVASCRELGQVFEPGRFFSYCNAGFVFAGRLIEVVTGKTWDEVLRERLLQPLGMGRSCTLPEEALLHRAAVGHLPNPQNPDEIIKAPVWVLPRSVGPAGLICSTPAELLRFARLHIDGGVASDGTRLLSEDSVQQMQQPQVELPDRYTLGSHWGLGWILFEWDGRRVVGHDGGTIGQTAYLRIVPEERFAVALLTNSTTAIPMYKELYDELFSERLGVHLPQPPQATDLVDFDLSRLVGVYERENDRTEIDQVGDGLVISQQYFGILEGLTPPIEKEPCKVVDETTLLYRNPVTGEDDALVFFDFEDGRPNFLHTGARAARRSS